MACDVESAWEFGLHLHGATGHFIHLAAHIAVEVMVVLLACTFIAWWDAGDLHGLQPTLFHQRNQVAIDRGKAEALHVVAGTLQNLFRRERALRLVKGAADGLLLACIALGRHRLFAV